MRAIGKRIEDSNLVCPISIQRNELRITGDCFPVDDQHERPVDRQQHQREPHQDCTCAPMSMLIASPAITSTVSPGHRWITAGRYRRARCLLRLSSDTVARPETKKQDHRESDKCHQCLSTSVTRPSRWIQTWNPLVQRRHWREWVMRLRLIPIGYREEVVGAMVGIAMLDRGAQ